MTVLIRIHNNEAYCDAHCPEKIKVENVECWCINHPDDIAPVDCPGCKGKGSYEFKSYPYELNLANFNFTMVWNALLLDNADQPAGDVHPAKVLKAVMNVRPELLMRADMSEAHNWFEVGVDRSDVEYYIITLKEIALEACRREEYISWD